MSVAKVNTVNKAAKDQGSCMKCGDKLPKGSAYLWYTVGFRSRSKYVRCTKPECFPKPSERESSKLADVYGAMEDASASIDIADGDTPGELIGNLQEQLQVVADTIREVADQYRESATNPNTGIVFNTASEERADTLDSAAEELEGWQPNDSEPDRCGEHQDEDLDSDEVQECDDCIAMGEEWADTVRSEALEALTNVELG